MGLTCQLWAACAVACVAVILMAAMVFGEPNLIQKKQHASHSHHHKSHRKIQRYDEGDGDAKNSSRVTEDPWEVPEPPPPIWVRSPVGPRKLMKVSIVTFPLTPAACGSIIKSHTEHLYIISICPLPHLFQRLFHLNEYWLIVTLLLYTISNIVPPFR